MKSQVLIKAWELFRTYEITFSQALIDAWKLAKRESVKIEFANTDTSLTEKRAELLNKFNSLKAAKEHAECFTEKENITVIDPPKTRALGD